jgi:hypothetical protein
VRAAIKAAAEQEPVAYLSTDPMLWDRCRIKRQGAFTFPVFTHPPAAQQDQWKESLIERCIRAGIGFNEEDPESTLTELIKWEVLIATDPQVNGAQQDSERLARGYKTGLCISNPEGGKVVLHYTSKEAAEAAFEWISQAIDAAIQAGKEVNPNQE